MEAFPRAVAAALGARVRTGVAVTAIEPGPGGRSRVALSDGGVREPDEVLLAVPAPAQARLLAPLSRTASQALGAVRYVPIVVVYVGLPPGSAPPVPASFGFLRGRGAPDRILGCAIATSLDPTAAPPGHALLRVFLGGGRDPDAIDLDDDSLRAVVERDLARALGGPVRADVVSVVRHPAAIPVFSPGHRARMAAAGGLLARFGVRLSGSHVTGVGVDACCRPS
jgi:oxygen-dependent protoporphyrinogen oxidase